MPMLWLLLQKTFKLGGRTRHEKGAPERTGGLTTCDLPSSPLFRSLFAPLARRWRLASLAIMLLGGVIAGFMGGIGMPLYQVALAMAGCSLVAVLASLVADNLSAEPPPSPRT